jgi:hypothetical protein
MDLASAYAVLTHPDVLEPVERLVSGSSILQEHHRESLTLAGNISKCDHAYLHSLQYTSARQFRPGRRGGHSRQSSYILVRTCARRLASTREPFFHSVLMLLFEGITSGLRGRKLIL